MTLETLKKSHDAFRQAHPRVRIREAAHALAVSEAALVAAGGATRLAGPWESLLRELESLGQVMALTRNDACVHEKHGVYRNVRMFKVHDMGLVLDRNIDLRLFMRHWHFGYAVGPRRSLQFFDASGTAVHKVFLTRKSDEAAYDRIVGTYRDRRPATLPAVRPFPPNRPRRGANVDAGGLLAAWEALKDSHDFFPMLQSHGAGRVQALAIAEGSFTERLAREGARRLLQTVGAHPIMVFVGNRGCIQIHTGPVKKLKWHGPWFNVLDPGFSLHLREERIASCWLVRKPSNAGIITSIEAFDEREELVVQFFEKRKTESKESEAWRQIVADLPRLAVPVAG